MATVTMHGPLTVELVNGLTPDRKVIQITDQHGLSILVYPGSLEALQEFDEKLHGDIEAALWEASRNAKLEAADKCYTCGNSGVTLNSVPLQEDGPRRVLVCGTCKAGIDSGEIVRQQS